MTEAVAAEPSVSPKRSLLARVLKIAAIIALIGAITWALGWNIGSWFTSLWDVLTAISVGYIIAGCAFKTVQTVATATGWYWILRTAYGPEKVSRRVVLACYATGVALNTFVPANLGTLVCLLMFAAVIEGATFSGVLGGYVVQKIFFTVAGAFVYLYLFLSVGGSFNIKFDWISDHIVGTIVIIGGAIVLIGMLVRILRAKIAKFWAEAKEGGQVLAHPRLYLAHVALPSLIGWLASIAVIGVFLAAYAIPVTFDTIMWVMGGNSIANVLSVTPGGVGVNQAFNVATLSHVTDATTATAYSVAQQLVTTAWNILFAIGMVCWVFGWSGGKQLIGSSYEDAKRKAAEQKEARRLKKAATQEG
jgi:uncharacterized membrane protein YbhN (UPF0104 family)